MSATTLKILAAAAVASVALTAQAAAFCGWTERQVAYVTIHLSRAEKISCLVPVKVDPIRPWVRFEIGKEAVGQVPPYPCIRADGSLLTGVLTMNINRPGESCLLSSVSAESYLMDPSISRLDGVMTSGYSSIFGNFGDYPISLMFSPWRG